MSRYPNESVAAWYERAIVANSMAAAESDKFAAVANLNPTARRVIGKRVEDAAAELNRALDAFLAERRENSGQVERARTSSADPAMSISVPTHERRRQQSGAGNRAPVAGPTRQS